ncbi:Proline/betaine transporter [Aquicella siphonis]|uniref:Proline/betaine transporter n=1 Tax=Aquicella siphonis TaxID=254247 RepID=A0A5E4PGE7_9COXI|nr:MFS transporter [Aquicella siphonis]VVC75542.1 Proline/betaine transporter [Aquicella siphonis]
MQALAKRNMWHIILGGTIGNLNEWYNFLLYGYLASTISQLFFPSKNSLLSLTLTFTVFALSFFVRPLGGVLFGWIGDTYGRQRALILSLVMMGVPTLLIGCLPTYDSIGLASPILLCLLRISQGLSAGGEHTGSAVYIAEYAPASRRSLWVSTVPTSAALGILISSTASLLIINSFSQQQLLAWGWRVGYWAGAALCLVSILLRITMPETPYFRNRQNEKMERKRYPVSALLKDHRVFKNLLIVIGLASCWGIFYQILFIWMPTYLTNVQHYSHEFALQVNSFYILCLACLVLMFGYVSDYINRKAILYASCIAMAILAYPLFVMFSSGSISQVYIAMGTFTFIFSLFLPTAFVSMVESFDTLNRYTGLSFGFNIGLAVFGGTCPLIATWLIEMTKNNSSPAIYMILASCFALWTSTHIQEKRGQPI